MRLWIIQLLVLTSLTGCPDPVATSNELGSGTAGSGGGQQNPGTMQNNGPSSQESNPSAARMQIKPGEGLKVKGKFVYAGTATGSIRIDVQQYKAGSAPSLVNTLELKSMGDFDFEVPKNFGKIIITGFIDKDGNGPTSDDPQGRITLDIKEENFTEVKLEVADDFQPPPTQPQPGSAGGKGQPGTPGQPNSGSPNGQPGNPSGQPSEAGQPAAPGTPGGKPVAPGSAGGQPAPSDGKSGQPQGTPAKPNDAAGTPPEKTPAEPPKAP